MITTMKKGAFIGHDPVIQNKFRENMCRVIVGLRSYPAFVLSFVALMPPSGGVKVASVKSSML